MGLGSPSPSASAAEQASECGGGVSDDQQDFDPFKDATPKQALVAIAMIFVLGLLIGFALGRTL